MKIYASNENEKANVLEEADNHRSFLSFSLNNSTSRLSTLELGACVFRFSVHREVQPPTTNLLADWIDGWSRQLGGGRRRTGPALAIPAGTTLGYVQRVLYRVGGLERGI